MEYPRCETCRHWKQMGSVGVLDEMGYTILWKTGECSKLQSGGDDLLSILSNDERTVLDVDSRFGCVLHEVKDA